jgi:hypothetical protein
MTRPGQLKWEKSRFRREPIHRPKGLAVVQDIKLSPLAVLAGLIL